QAKESLSSCRWSISEAYFLTHEQPSFQSPELPVPNFPGCVWYIEIYPNGTKNDNAGNVSLFFHCSVNQTLITYVSLTTEGSESFTYVFEKNNNHGQGYPSFISHDELLNSENNHVSDGKVTIGCNVKFVSITDPPILLGSNTHYLKDQASAKYLPQLLQEYGDEMFDCVLKVGDVEIKTYRLILSIYSPVFKTMFSVPMEENRNGVVKLVDFTADAVKTAINFFYTCEIEAIESSEQLEELFRFSDKYDIAALKTYRLILSIYSPVFKTMFSVPMEENRNGVVKLVDFTADAVKTAINFFYTCEIEAIESSEQLEELFRFSDKYDIAALKEYLENESGSKLSDQNVCILLEMAVRSNAFRLKDACFSFLEECIMIGASVQGLEELDSGILKDVVISAMKKRQGAAVPIVQDAGNINEENEVVGSGE
uniref:BTB domain-containing protein n=1 Tax=Panagrolaimus sp. ES5 TaxID=591445 RepID=A0AC34G256_9BILA